MGVCEAYVDVAVVVDAYGLDVLVTVEVAVGVLVGEEGAVEVAATVGVATVGVGEAPLRMCTLRRAR